MELSASVLLDQRSSPWLIKTILLIKAYYIGNVKTINKGVVK